MSQPNSDEFFAHATPVSRIDSFATFRDSWSSLESGKGDETIRFSVTGQVVAKRLMGKSLAFLQVRDGYNVDNTDQLQLLLNLREIPLPTNSGDAISSTYAFIDRGLHMGDEIYVEGYPQKTKVGVVSLNCVTVAISKLWPKGSLFDPGAVRRQVLAEKVADGVDSMPLCKFTLRGEPCRRPGCVRRHETTLKEQQRIDRLLSRRAEVVTAEHDSDDPSTEKESKRQRAKLFAAWIVDKWGVDYLNSGSGVLDVAGGLGRLSFILQVEYKVKVTLIDPRKYKLTKKQATELKDHKMELFDQIQDYFDENLYEHSEEHAAMLQNSSLVVGLHPDQATEPIADFALKYKKSFAIIPCCVFSYLFPDRRLKEGNKVITYFDFIQYLQEKESDVKKDFLPMTGRNKILYRDIL